MRRILAGIIVIAVLSAGTTAVLASVNYYPKPYDVTAPEGDWLADPLNIGNGIVIQHRSWGVFSCYRGSNDYYGLVSFYDSTDDFTSMMLDGRGSCMDDAIQRERGKAHTEDKGLDIGSRMGPLMLWTGDQTGTGTYKWSIRQDGTLVPLNGTGQIGQEGGFAHFGNPTVYAEDVRLEDPSWSLLERLGEIETRLSELER